MPDVEPLVRKRTAFLEGKPTTYVIDNAFEADVYGPLNVGLQEIALGLATPEQVANRVQQAFDTVVPLTAINVNVGLAAKPSRFAATATHGMTPRGRF